MRHTNAVHLAGISWVYDGSLTQYTGRQIKIQYCMFSSTTDYSEEGRCNFAFAVAAVSLVFSFVWSYMQVGRGCVFKTQGLHGLHSEFYAEEQPYPSASSTPGTCTYTWWLHAGAMLPPHLLVGVGYSDATS